MLDFTQAPSTPSVMRDFLDIIERLLQYRKDEADIPTLIELLAIIRKRPKTHTIIPDFHSLFGRIERELTNEAFLISLANIAKKSRKDANDVLRFFQQIGNAAVMGVCEVLARLKDPLIQIEACDTLLMIAKDNITKIIETFDIDNPYEAKSAVYLLRRSIISEVPPIIEKIMNSPSAQVRENVITFLVHAGSDKAAQLLCKLLEDDNVSVRVKAFSSVADFRHSLIIKKVTSLCFAEDIDTKSTDEQMRMFKTLGMLAEQDALFPIHHMIKNNKWFSFNKSKNKQNKLLAIEALKHISGIESLKILNKLACDGDRLVKTKAQHVLKHLNGEGAMPEEERDMVTSEESSQ
jgi:hypothetical protein